MQKYSLENLDCVSCATNIEDAVKQTPGVRFARVDFTTTTLTLDTDDLFKVARTIERIDPKVKLHKKEGNSLSGVVPTLRTELIPILVAGFLFILGLIFRSQLHTLPYSIGEYMVFGTAYLVSGWGVLSSAFRNIAHGRIFDEHFLMSVATIGAIAIGEIPEAAGVMLFYLVGEFVQGLSVRRSRRSIQELLEIKPDRATLVFEGETRVVHPDVVQVGDTVLVRPGEKIPVDGKVLQGNSQVDTSPLTGESVPKNISPGKVVLAGSINKNGTLAIEVTRPFGESSISRILEMVENASSRKAVTEKFITKFARIYSPAVVFGALAVALLPPLLTGASFSEWFSRALVILVISCPCALVISIPLGYFGGVGGASRRGILVKGSTFLDILASVKTVIFDKTGTLTKGNFKVTQVNPQVGFSEGDLLRLAAQAEVNSNHPIAHSIREAYGGSLTLPIQEYQEIAGHGVQATVEDRVFLAGNDPLLHRENVSHVLDICEVQGTVVHVALDGKYAGFLVVSDELKEDSVDTIRDLRACGIEHIAILTGDTQDTAQEIADQLGVDDFKAKLLPEGKIAALEEILAGIEPPGKVAFIGDGINDAPALARADVGIAMGALGSEAAIETADVVIMTDSPAKVVEAIRIGRKTRRIVWQNIVFALVVKAFFIVLGISGEASMWQAVFGDMGVALIAVLNATRVLR
jgi:Cd2+/Zn2+-exporting ATPase